MSDSKDDNGFAGEAEQKNQSVVSEFFEFLLQNKKWWLTPVLVILVILGVLVLIGGTAAGPFIYSFF